MFNIGGWEVVFILILILLLWKPEELEDRARQLGRWWARLTHSPWWREMLHLRYRAEQFFYDAAREANLEEAFQEVKQAGRAPRDVPWASRAFQPPPPHPDATPTDRAESAAPTPAADARAASTPPPAPAEPSSPAPHPDDAEPSP